MIKKVLLLDSKMIKVKPHAFEGNEATEYTELACIQSTLPPTLIQSLIVRQSIPPSFPLKQSKISH